MRTLLLVSLTLALALAGCSDNGDADGVDGSGPDGEATGALPAAIYDNQTVQAGIDVFNLLPSDPTDPMSAGSPCATPASTCFDYPFTVNASADLTATITWTQPSSDFDLYLYDAGGSLVSSGTSGLDSMVMSESFSSGLAPGEYRVTVVAWLVVMDSYSLAVTFE